MNRNELKEVLPTFHTGTEITLKPIFGAMYAHAPYARYDLGLDQENRRRTLLKQQLELPYEEGTVTVDQTTEYLGEYPPIAIFQRTETFTTVAGKTTDRVIIEEHYRLGDNDPSYKSHPTIEPLQSTSGRYKVPVVLDTMRGHIALVKEALKGRISTRPPYRMNGFLNNLPYE